MRADASSHRYARHSHEGYALGVVEAGAHAFAARGPVWNAIPGRIVIVNPGDLIVADGDGVVCVRSEEAEEAVAGARARLDRAPPSSKPHPAALPRPSTRCVTSPRATLKAINRGSVPFPA